MIPVYIASSDRFSDIEWMTAGSILENTSAECAIHVIRPEHIGMKSHGCTGFTNLRYAVPELLRQHGHEFGIYLDVDMLVLADIRELYRYRLTDAWVGLADGSSEVAVVHCDLLFPSIDRLHNYHKTELHNMAPRLDAIPLWWNCEDCVPPGAKLVHYTNLDTQPWFYDHPDSDAAALYESYRERLCGQDGMGLA